MGVRGVAPQSKIVSIKSLDDSGFGSYEFIAEGLRIAKDLNVDIVNMSLGSQMSPPDDTIHNIIKEIAANGKIIVCAAGNDAGDVNYPAKYDEVIAVAAVESSGQLAKFSSRGPELDIAAPGVKIYSTWGNNQYVNLDGTSMATPCITGIIALLLSWYKAHPDPSFVVNYSNIIKLLYGLGDEEGNNILKTGEYSIGVPKLHNFNPWKTN
jgi:subtilisin family serine protease